ncbi:putative c6 finger domain [Phaeomoniella chlamydospora]|uniref:Putative c6 finger domain n=1 Tax=Phaeomoniella chlamydospora TaxID=158046 RepID=A0A0G2F0S0_PHACM|nr:putative c6 finger domain [Phaeomoniella chlamydospora]
MEAYVDPLTTGQSVSTFPYPTGISSNDLTFNELFNYASFMWDDTQSSTISPGQWNQFDPVPMNNDYFSPGISRAGNMAQQQPQGTPDTGSSAKDAMPTSSSFDYSLGAIPDDNQLSDYFKRSDAPPILAPVETQFRWVAMRKLFASMSSSMVKYAVMAFSALQLEQKTDIRTNNYVFYYDKSRRALSDFIMDAGSNTQRIANELQHILAVLFLLSYIDLVTDRATFAHANLREAYNIFRCLDLRTLDAPGKIPALSPTAGFSLSFSPKMYPEKRLISWIRLLDARAVSAGGEGLFLSEEDDTVIGLDLSPSQNPLGVEEDDVEDALYDTLSKPAYQFFHKVQSFMGRTSKIDQWHRHRGTVEDETEVMAIAAVIRKDIQALYQQRPILMDHAVAGRLQTPYLSENLAASMTRSLRTYLANYHASFIHLHRVAYKSLPRTAEVVNATIIIRQMAKLITDAQGPEESLPVNMLWPLLMWGCEEDDQDERQWILYAIRKMQNSATNAKITADVLQEVQKQQDETKQRVDVRTIMHETFNSCFAIV